MFKNISELTLCSGCGVCYAICPYDAIEMKVFLDGNYRPFVDFSKCRGCNLCKKVCPSLFVDGMDGLGRHINCYIAYSADMDLRWEASSGGLVTTIARAAKGS